MGQSELVSILIPNYNKAPYLRETLDSILAQTYRNWECIIVDDHSTDDSWEILEDYGSKDARFKVYRRPESFSKGANSCRNYAIEKATGGFVQYLDSDDIIHKDKISRQIEYSLYNSESLTFSNWEFFGSENCNKYLSRYKYTGSALNSIELLGQLWSMQKFIPIFCYLIPRKLIRQTWRNYLVKNQDGDFFFRLLLEADKVKFIDDAHGFYRIPNETHITGNKSFAAFRSDFMTLSSYEDILSVRSDESTVAGLVNNYVHFIVRSIDVFPVLAKLASQRLLMLDPKFKHVKLYKRYFELYKIFGFGFSKWIRMNFIRLKRY